MKRTAGAATYEPICEPIADQVKKKSTKSEEVIISCYENDVPSCIEGEMDRIYGSIYSSLPHFRIYSDDRDTSTYIVRKDGKISTIFLFRNENGNVRVLNEVMKVEPDDIARFTSYIFATFGTANVISFKSVLTDLRKLKFPYQHFNHLEDIVLTLPNTAEDYLESLGKNTRRNIKRYTKKIEETLPTFKFEVLEGEQVDLQTIRDIVNLNRARMAGKQKISIINEEDEERLFLHARKCGLVGVVKVDGKVCAGGISFRAGSNYFLNVIAHDPAYDDYWLGILCCYLTICACIARGAKEFHFLWGQYDYKYTLLGVKRDLDNITIYRSYAHLLLNSDMAMNIALKGYIRQAKLWLHSIKRQDHVLTRLATTSLNRLRSLKRSTQSASARSS
jgi:hypothetical protein